uniref:ATP-binding protein n=1 Tax=Rhodococcus qingshengii TaxID=334542 RepID=UPI001C4E07E0|nr:ATP-binding protein [Rhodococcus qingshengii]
MLQPITAVGGNLRWTRSGTVWADFILTGIEYGYRPAEDKSTARSMHKMLMRALDGEALLLGICASLNPEAVVARMEEGIDLDAHPQWAAECDATIETLEMFQPGKRIYWLSIPLANKGWKNQAAAAWSAARTTLTDYLGLPRTSLDPEEVARRTTQANMIATDIPAYFRPTPATPAQMVWLHQHSLQRGLGLDSDVPLPYASIGTKPMAAFTAARFDEGAQSDRPSSGWKSKAPTLTKALKIDQPWTLEERPANYQCLLALADTPSGNTVFPGSEFLALADAIAGVDVDWGIRLHIRSSAEVSKKNKRALINLNEQFSQREGEVSHGHGVLHAAAEDLAEYAAKMDADNMEVEVQSTTIFAIGAHTEEVALRDARQLAKLFELSSYKLVSPLGFQEDLWHALNPGVSTPSIVKEFAQITTSTDFSAYVPCVHNDLGDSSGPLLALNISSARIGVVHHDVAKKSAADISGSFAAVGALGSGKSVLLKGIGGAFHDRGGKIVVIDHTEVGEYARWAATIAEAVIADLSHPKWSLDPLRIFGPDKGAEVATSVLLPLLQLQPDEPLGVLLGTVLEPAYRGEHGLLDGGLGDILDHLRSDECTLVQRIELADKLGVYARKSYAAALFEKGLPALDITAQAIVFRTHTVKLPSQQEIVQEHLFRQLGLEKRVGRAMYALIGLIARGICFANPSEPAMFLADECHRMTRAEEGVDIVIDFLREGRKEQAYIGLGSQDPDEGLGNETLRGLIPTRFAMRQTDATLARRSLAFVGLDPRDPDMFKELTEQTSPVSGKDPDTGAEYVEPHRRGEGYMRDAYGNIGRIKVLMPSEPNRAHATQTTPDKAPKELIDA